MRRGFALFIIFALVLTTAGFADVSRTPIKNLKFIGGSDEPAPPPALPLSQHRFPTQSSLDELVGTAYQVGTTYYDDQHNGTAGKMIGVDETGWIHLVWTNGLNVSHSNRVVFYDVWDPTSETFLYHEDGGTQVSSANRSGYVSMAVSSNGMCYPSFHQETTSNDAHAAVSMDFLPQSGAFNMANEPAYLSDTRCGAADDMEIIWPHITMDVNNVLHMVSSENPCTGEAGDPQRIYYSRGIPTYDEFGFGSAVEWQPVAGDDEFMEVDTVMVLAPDICSSRNSDRVVIAWAKSRDGLLPQDSATQRNNDIVYMVSEDGGLNWGSEINITNFEAPDYECLSADTAECDRDTFRVYTDLSVIFDPDDNIHIAFTTTCYWALEGTVSRYASQIWHWSDRCDEISPIRAITPDYLTENWALEIGDWQYILQRPSLSCDDVTSNLYCSYQLSDTNQWSEINIPQSDAWVSRSVDGGRSWSQGVNVTNTDGGQGTSAGSNASEMSITLSETVAYYEGIGYLNMEYVYDLDAGPGVGDNPTGTSTLNPVYYQRIPVSEIPVEPRWGHTWPQIHVDGRQVPYGGNPNPPAFEFCGEAADDNRSDVPHSFKLYQNYPNPFNPTTHIQFDLAKNMNVSLTIFNVLGQEVASLLNNKALTAGVQVIDFDATNLPSGVYVYQLKAEGLSLSRKMVLLK
jgi:hypothetical protein